MLFLIYLFILTFSTIYLYIVEKKSSTIFYKQLIVWAPAFIIFFIFPSFQYQVGTDYNTYYNYFFDQGHLLHKEKGEFLYFYLVELVIFFGDPQLQFFLVSIIQGILFFYLLFLLKIRGYKSWLIYMVYFLCTGIYNNQMNGLRQFICIYIFLINSIIIYDKRFLSFSINSFVSLYIHFSSVFSNIILLLLSFVKGRNNKWFLFLIFNLSFFFYLPSYKDLIFELMTKFDIRYLMYMDSEFSDNIEIASILTKFYYTPVIFLFWFYYLNDKNEDDFLSFMILIFSLTYFLFLQSIDFSLMARIWQYMNFFLVFPIYYVVKKSIGVTRLFIILYLAFFYMVKVLFFSTAEYDYSFYWKWF